MGVRLRRFIDLTKLSGELLRGRARAYPLLMIQTYYYVRVRACFVLSSTILQMRCPDEEPVRNILLQGSVVDSGWQRTMNLLDVRRRPDWPSQAQNSSDGLREVTRSL